jgi:cell wall-associated NlpC family hydrolase
MPLHRLASVVFAGVALSACATLNSSNGTAPRPSPFPEPAGRPAIFRPAPTEISALAPNVKSFSTASFLMTAEKLQGIPYQLGGDSPKTGFDCSGYTKYVFGLYRILLPRTVAEQIHAGKPAGSVIRAGDLLFFRMAGPKSPVSHVALALSADEFIHAPGADGQVRTEKLSPYWRSRLVTARRIL